jgi:aspartate/methionine/tyrosine aminotransferase
MAMVPQSGTLRMLDIAKQMERDGREIIHMEVGEPDFDTPEHIKRAAREALARGATKYTPSAGIPELREAIVEHLKGKGVPAAAKEVLVTPGAKHAIFCAMAAALDPGDEVLIPSPCWTYGGIALMVGAKPVYIETTQADEFRLKVENVEKKLTSKTRMLVLNYPNNPTGATMTKRNLRALADLAVDHEFWVLSDDIYDCLVYEGEHVSIASLPNMHERTIYINGFSKAYAMTGWRLGYAVAPAELTKEMIKVQQASTSCAAAFVQAAGVAALRGPQGCVGEMRREYRRRRDVIVKGLNSIEGFKCTKPNGAFYVFPNIEELGMKSSELCEGLLKEAGVAAVPGSEFGPYGEGHLRFSYATSMQNIKKAIGRIESAIERL